MGRRNHKSKNRKTKNKKHKQKHEAPNQISHQQRAPRPQQGVIVINKNSKKMKQRAERTAAIGNEIFGGVYYTLSEDPEYMKNR